MKHTILVGHNLAKGGGITFAMTDHETAKEFETLADARKYIIEYYEPRIWTTYILIPAPL